MSVAQVLTDIWWDPMSVAWPWLLGIALISRASGSGLFLLSLAALATCSVLDTLEISERVLGEHGAEIACVAGLIGVVLGSVTCAATTLMGDNLFAAAVSAFFTGTMKVVGAIVVAPFPMIFGKKLGGGG